MLLITLLLYMKIWCQAGSDHDPVALCLRLRDVLGAVREFVSAHPTELVAIHVTSGEGSGDWRASVDWKACQSVVLEVLRDKLVPEHMREMPLGNSSYSHASSSRASPRSLKRQRQELLFGAIARGPEGRKILSVVQRPSPGRRFRAVSYTHLTLPTNREV